MEAPVDECQKVVFFFFLYLTFWRLSLTSCQVSRTGSVHHVVVLLRLRTLQTYWSTYISEVLIVSIFYSRVKTPYIYYVPNIPSNDTVSVC
ncbi:hypothetical protein AB205_0201410 [Aquarana catesbeiana]|uniref:Uncharacterized protein n=1 Tax=Aquarana catesbeiana TaxID=8400 RepID=A0A2G9QM96_AQUCT|nr:hypothetical protein AB205_0201410 [Aquarana catesbeiana]